MNIKGINFLADGTGSIGDNLVALTVADFLSQTSAAALVSVADTAVNSVAQIRTELGAFSNRLSRSQINIQTIMENTANAESIVRDADFAAEASAMTRAQILTQSGISMLSQANLIPQQALSLLQF